ncbi:hypothetical protein PMAYCL1PPCAC_10061, partial [Pristionchus mayeri]
QAHASPSIPFNAPACQADKDYWNMKTLSAQCPWGCPPDPNRADNKDTRTKHYLSVKLPILVHYDVYFARVTSKRNLIESFLKEIGD